MTALMIEPLSAAAFKPFGDVIEMDGTLPATINQGLTIWLSSTLRPKVAGSM
jgi:ureidoglycolate hydrolase